MRDPFQTEGPIMPEERQIGRMRAIDSLEHELAEHRRHVLLLEPRRIGKTSVARAALARIRKGRGVGLDVDLSNSALQSPEDLARELAAQARTAGVGVREPGRLRRLTSRTARAATTLTALGVEIARVLGADIDDGVPGALAKVQETLEAVDADTPVSLANVLDALELAAQLSPEPLVIFLDECQRLLAWGVAEQQIDVAMRREGRRLVFLFAGSDRRALEELFAQGRPLHRNGLRVRLDPIAIDDWIPALVERFDQVGLSADPERVVAILDASGGHPQRTMQVCAHVQRWCRDTGQGEVDDQIVKNAVASARDQPSWDT